MSRRNVQGWDHEEEIELDGGDAIDDERGHERWIFSLDWGWSYLRNRETIIHL